MGRNVISSVDDFSLSLSNKSMSFKKLNFSLTTENLFSIILLFVLFIVPLNLFSQSDPVKGKKSDFSFKIAQKYTENSPYVYHYIQRDTVRRVFSDKSEKIYLRDVDYYITITAENPPQDGFLTITINIDSMTYRLKDGEAEFKFSSQEKLGGSGIEFDDMEFYNASLGRMFDLTLSPYGKVSSLGGEQLEWIRDYVLQGKGKISEKKMYIWDRALSDKNLAFITDIRKFEVPLGYLKIDTSWVSPLNFELNGLSYQGDVTALITDFETGHAHISAKLDSLSCNQEKSLFYGINELVDIVDSKLKGTYTVDINNNGSVDIASLKAEIETDARIKKEYFKEYTHTEIKWILLGRYVYKSEK